MTEYPKMLYRPGFEIEWDGRHLEMIVVDDNKAQTRAIADGYVLASDLFRLDAKD